MGCRFWSAVAVTTWPALLGPAADPALEANAAAVRAVPRIHLEAVHELKPVPRPGVSGSTDRIKLWVAPDFCRAVRDNGGVTTTGVRTPAGARVASLPRTVTRNSPGSAGMGDSLAAGMRSTVLADLLWWQGTDDAGEPLLDYLTREGVTPAVRRESGTAVWVEFADPGPLKSKRRVRLSGTHGWLADRLEGEYPMGNGQTARHTTEVTGFKPLAAGGWFPTGSTTAVFADDTPIANHRLTADLKGTDFQITPELAAVRFPANIAVVDSKRRMMVKTDAAGNLTRDEYPSEPSAAELPPAGPTPGPTPPDADDPPAVGPAGWAAVAGAALLIVLGAVALSRRRS